MVSIRSMMNSLAAVALVLSPVRPAIGQTGDPAGQGRVVGVCVNTSYKGTDEDRTTFGQSDQRVEVSYRYNPLIVVKWQTARDHVQAAISDLDRPDSRLSPEQRPYLVERLAWLDNDQNRIEMARQAPSFWYLESRRSALLIHDAPLVASLSETCDWKNSPDPVESEFALFYGQNSPRVRGDFCAETPLIVFEGVTRPQIARFYQSALVTPEGVPLRRLLASLQRDYRSDPFLMAIAQIMTLREAQCRVPVGQMDVIFEAQHRPIKLPMREFDQDALAPVLSLRITVDGERILAETVGTSAASHQAAAAVAQSRANAERMARRDEGAELRFAVGTVLLLGSLAVVGTAARMRCDEPLDNVNPFWQPPAHCD